MSNQMITGAGLMLGVMDDSGKVFKEVAFTDKAVEIKIDSSAMDDFSADMRGISCDPLSVEWTGNIRANRKSYRTIRQMIIGPKVRIPRKLKKKLKKLNQ